MNKWVKFGIALAISFVVATIFILGAAIYSIWFQV